MLKSTTLLVIISALLIVFIVAIVISPYVDIPESGLRAQTILLLFFSALLGALQFCAGSISEQSIFQDCLRREAPDLLYLPLSTVLLC